VFVDDDLIGSFVGRELLFSHLQYKKIFFLRWYIFITIQTAYSEDLLKYPQLLLV